MARRTGDAIPPFLIKQLEVRESVNDKNNSNYRKSYQLNANSAWVKLRSSINRLDLEKFNNDKLDELLLDRKKALDADNETTSDYAESFVLIAGTQATNQKPRGGINRSTFDSITKAYNNYNGEYGLGFRPMPGITGLEVKSKGTYGTLIEAIVNFKVFSLEDLEVCELIYFRPGYTTLLEWGHSVYLNNDNEIVQANPDSTLPDNFFFKAQCLSMIDKRIQELRNTSNGNYDGIIGFISNFSFSLQPDGSYDCTVKILSRGVILEGLKPSMSSDHQTKDEEEKAEEDVRKYKSIYHYLFDAVASSNPKGPNINLKKALEDRKEPQLASKISDKILLHAYESDIKGHYLGPEVDEIPIMYLTLGDFLSIVNSVNSLGNPKRIKVADNIIDWLFGTEADNDRAAFSAPSSDDPCADAKDFIPFDLTPGNKFATFPDHVSCDPVVALPAAVPSGESRDILGTKGAVGLWEGFVTWLGANWYIKSAGDVYKRCTIDSLHSDMESEAINRGGVNETLNIYISTFAVEKVLDDMLVGPQDENIGMYQVIDNLLSLINGALGGVNELSLHYNHEAGRYQIIDRAYKPAGKLPVINVSGLKSTIENISIDSTISPAIATQVAIAAQGNSGNYKDNVSAILEWNRGAIDRHMPVRHMEDSKDEEDSSKKKSKYLKKLTKFFDKWNDRGGIWTNQVYDFEAIESLRSEIASDMIKLQKHYQVKNQERPNGVVPVELSFDLKGIHGFVIGTTFKINKGLLPSKYDNWAYIVTGISHKIGTDNKWVTSVKTQFYPDRTSSSSSAKALKDQARGFVDDNPSRPETVQTIDEINQANNANADRLRQVLANLGFEEKGRELSNGGDITSKTADMGASVFTTIKNELPGVHVRVTGGNDLYHQKLPYNSRHKKGTGLDFVITPPTPQNIKKVLNILQGYAVGDNPNFRFKNEYASPTAKATAKHFHISWGNGTEGQKELEEAKKIAQFEPNKLKNYNV